MNQRLLLLEKQAKQLIDYPQLISSISPDRGVVAPWGDLSRFLPQAEKGWSLIHDDVFFTEIPGLIARSVQFSKGDAQLSIDIYVSSRGPEPAVRRLIESMLATSTGLQAFKRGPANVGQLCLTLPTASPSIFVINHNVLLDLRVDEYSMDLVELAKSITSYMDTFVEPKLSGQLPRIVKTALLPERPVMNQPVRIDFTLQPAFNRQNLMLSLPNNIDTDTFDLVGTAEAQVEVKVKRGGAVTLPVWLADRSTLLSSVIQVDLEVQPVR